MLVPHLGDVRVTGIDYFRDLPVRFLGSGLEHLGDQVAFLFAREVAAMDIERQRKRVGIATGKVLKLNSIAGQLRPLRALVQALRPRIRPSLLVVERAEHRQRIEPIAAVEQQPDHRLHHR